MQSEITVKNLKKYFAEIKAVDDISFTVQKGELFGFLGVNGCLLYTSPSPRDRTRSRMPSSA